MSALVTGLGVVAPNGLGTEEYWAATLAGKSGLGPITRFDASSYPARVAGEVPGFTAADHLPSRLLPQTDQMTRLALVAADWALRDAGVRAEELPEYAAGVVTAASGGGVEFGQRELQALWEHGREHVSAYQSFAWFYAVNTGQISIRQRTKGPSGVLVTEQAGGLDALGQARREVRKGVRLMLSGGVDGALCPWGWVAQLATGRVSEAGSTCPSRPRRAATCRARAARSWWSRRLRRHGSAGPPTATANSPATPPPWTRLPAAAARRGSGAPRRTRWPTPG